jgi:hypothetical protein
MPLPLYPGPEDFSGLERLDRTELDDETEDSWVEESGLVRVPRKKNQTTRE